MRYRPNITHSAAALLVFGVACAPADSGVAADSAPTTIPGVSGPALPMGAPADAGLSEEVLDRIAPAMQEYVDDGRLPGVVTMVARGGKIVHWEAVGMRNIEEATLLQPDDIFRIASMTKPITSTAIMMLVESGDIALDDPVSKFIPAFANMSVLEDDGSGTPVDPPMTVRHLLSHSGGLTYGIFGDTPVDQAYVQAGLFGKETLEDYVATVAGLPLLAQPGEIWNYSVSTDVLGYIVQVVSGQPFEVFLEERIFEPLGMDDTAFWVPPEKRDRFTTHYRVSPEGLQVVDAPEDGRYTQMPGMASGGGGLVSTASDYFRFAQMILQRGQLDDVRILRPETVRTMGTNMLEDDITPISILGWLAPAYGFGLGFATLVDEGATPQADHDGLIRWGGLANTFFWIDPEAELIAMVWTQMDPFLIYRLEERFSAFVYDAMEDAAP
jgi:CubicO group peptidase (beta-lactamase class C family)